MFCLKQVWKDYVSSHSLDVSLQLSVFYEIGRCLWEGGGSTVTTKFWYVCAVTLKTVFIFSFITRAIGSELIQYFITVIFSQLISE